jgi:16S rRNA G966 N2-methylase RsmD
MDFVKMLNDIKGNPELLDIFDDQCLLWWNKKDLIDLIKDIVSKYFDKNSNTYNISVQFKMSLQSLIDNPKELLELINDCLKPKEVEKKENGEVFTPIKLVNEMLDKLPIEVWKNKNLKWLDPCCGMGNFPIAVYLRLIKELPIKDMKERKKHILENMLYMSELNKKNVLVCKQIFDINNELKLNIYEGDSLKVDYNKEFGIKQFDIIIGNPPYNASGTKASGNTIWQLFVNNSIKLLNSNGYICFVHPNGWRKPNTERGKLYGLFQKMTKENTLLYLEIHDAKDGMKQFNCGTRYDWYVLQKKKNENHKTKILDQNNISYEINLNKYNWLANCELELIDKLIANENEEKCNVLYTRNNYASDKKWTSNIETKEFKYPVLHSTPKDKPRFIWSNTNNNGHYGIKKVIFGYSGMNNPIIDIDGKYALSECAIGIVINNEIDANKLSKFLISNTFSKILKACLWSSFRIEWSMFKDFKKNFYELLDDKI